MPRLKIAGAFVFKHYKLLHAFVYTIHHLQFFLLRSYLVLLWQKTPQQCVWLFH